MRIAIHSHSSTAKSGGGVLYIYALAAALAEQHDVEVSYPPTVDLAAVPDQLPDFGARPRLRHGACADKRGLAREWCRLRGDRDTDAVLDQSLYVPRFTLKRRSVLLCEFPMSTRLTFGERVRLRRYGQVVANSHYTAGWIERRWGRRAAVLEPPVRPIPRLPKRPMILGVGRFMRGGRSKRQRELVTLFRQLVERGVAGWELHLAGFPGDRAYVDEVRRAAEGLPVFFHLDVDRSRLETLFGQASIFWHAVGLDEDPEAAPELMEHFGIVTVEAMSAGAVPVVINRGGQPEILGDPPCGIRWSTREDCLDATRHLIDDEDSREQLAERAQSRAGRYAFDSFAPRARRLFAEEA